MTAVTPGNAELLALADEIETSDGLYRLDSKLGEHQGYQLGIKKTAQVVAALRLAAKPDDDGVIRDAARYRWLKNMERQSRSNRWPHLTQWPYAPDIDPEKVPQVWEGGKYHPEHLDAAIDAAIANPAAAENEYMRARDAKVSTTGEPKR